MDCLIISLGCNKNRFPPNLKNVLPSDFYKKPGEIKNRWFDDQNTKIGN